MKIEFWVHYKWLVVILPVFVLSVCTASLTDNTNPEDAVSSDTALNDTAPGGATVVYTTAYKGITLDKDGRLIPTAWAAGMVQTFETGKTPIREIYVSENGKNSNDGSYDSPLATIARAIKLAAPGTAIRIMPGIYTENLYTSNLRGNADNPIWIGGVPGMERPQMRRIRIVGGSYIILHDMVLTGREQPVNLDDGGKRSNPQAAYNYVLRSIYAYNNDSVTFKFAGVNYVWIIDCEIGQIPGKGNVAAIDFVGCDNAVVAYNYIHSIDSGYAIQLKGSSYHGDIHNNFFVNAGKRGVQMGGSTGADYYRPPLTDSTYEARYIRTYSNIFINGEMPFLFSSSRDCFFVNNTVVNAGGNLFRTVKENNSVANGGNPHYNTVANNIFFNSGNGWVSGKVGDANGATNTLERNLFFPKGTPGSDSKLTFRNSILSDPLFRNLSGNNFALLPKSPAIGAGTTLVDVSFASRDYYGNPFKNKRSIGAIEYYTLDAVPTATRNVNGYNR